MSEQKTCSRCRQSKSLTEFKSDSRKPDGKASSCKSCVAVPKVGDLPLPASRALVPVFDARDAKAWATRITNRWRDSVEAIIDVGRLLEEAKAALPHGEFAAMCERDLPFTQRKAQMLMVIARDQRLSNPKFVSYLPPSWGTLYELTKLSDEEFDRGINEGVIRTDMIRAEAEQIRPLVRSPRSDGPGENQPEQRTDPHRASDETNSGPTGDSELTRSAREPSETNIMPSGGLAIAHRRVEPTDGADYFPTPPWATRALVEHVLAHLGRQGVCKFQFAWEPACGEGHMAEVLNEYFRKVYASDLYAYGYGDTGANFLHADLEGFDWIISNPPFNDSADFVLKALQLAGTGVAMFVRLSWLESVGRYEKIFRDRPPTLVAIFCERVPLHKGRWVEDGATMTAYVWLVWLKGAEPKAPFWIPPGCRERLTKPDDARRFTQSPVARAAQTQSQEEVA